MYLMRTLTVVSIFIVAACGAEGGQDPAQPQFSTTAGNVYLDVVPSGSASAGMFIDLKAIVYSGEPYRYTWTACYPYDPEYCTGKGQTYYPDNAIQDTFPNGVDYVKYHVGVVDASLTFLGEDYHTVYWNGTSCEPADPDCPDDEPVPQ